MIKLLISYWVALTMAASPAVQASAQAQTVEPAFKAGTHYELLEEAVPTETENNIEVREFFWYGCPHCYQMEPFVKTWLQSKPDGVELNRSPAAFNETWESHAKAYYVMKLTDKESQLHPLFFEAVKADTQAMIKEKNILAFFAQHGIDETTYRKIADSTKVSAKIATTKKIMAKAQLTGVPAFLVNGKYVVKSASSYQEMIDIVSFLVAKEKNAASVASKQP